MQRDCPVASFDHKLWMKKSIPAIRVSIFNFKFCQSSDKRSVSIRYGIDDKEKEVMAVRRVLPFAQKVNEWSFIDISKWDFDFFALPKHSAIASSNKAVQAIRGPLPKSKHVVCVSVKSGSKPFFVHDLPHSEFRSLFSSNEIPEGAMQPYIQLKYKNGENGERAKRQQRRRSRHTSSRCWKATSEPLRTR
jgi:hypothetical protein